MNTDFVMNLKERKLILLIGQLLFFVEQEDNVNHVVSLNYCLLLKVISTVWVESSFPPSHIWVGTS